MRRTLAIASPELYDPGHLPLSAKLGLLAGIMLVGLVLSLLAHFRYAPRIPLTQASSVKGPLQCCYP